MTVRERFTAEGLTAEAHIAELQARVDFAVNRLREIAAKRLPLMPDTRTMIVDIADALEGKVQK